MPSDLAATAGRLASLGSSMISVLSSNCIVPPISRSTAKRIIDMTRKRRVGLI
jgi:hypothetical protein